MGGDQSVQAATKYPQAIWVFGEAFGHPMDCEV
jgi:hypothetical protein